MRLFVRLSEGEKRFFSLRVVFIIIPTDGLSASGRRGEGFPRETRLDTHRKRQNRYLFKMARIVTRRFVSRLLPAREISLHFFRRKSHFERCTV